MEVNQKIGGGWIAGAAYNQANSLIALAANAWVLANASIANGGSGNVTTLNVSANIANVGNLLVTQNTFTGNLKVTTSTNVATLNISGVASSNQTPLINIGTRVQTGLTCNLTANAQTNNNTAQSNILSCTFNEAGMYTIDAFICFGVANTGGLATANYANVGMNIGFGNSGTATIASIKYTAIGKANGNNIISNLITTTAQTIIIPVSGSTQTGSIANSTNNTDYLFLTGYLNVSAVGTINIQFASANSLNANLNVATNSYVIYTKIG